MMNKNRDNQNFEPKCIKSWHVNNQNEKHHHKPIDNITSLTIMGDVEPNVQKAHEIPTKGTQD